MTPVAWIGPHGELMRHGIYLAWAPRYQDEARGFSPLYPVSIADGERFTMDQVTSAISAFLRFGEQVAPQSHFGGHGWAARCLRAHLAALEAKP